MNTLLIIWLTINAMIGLPVLGFAVYCKIQDLRSKQSGGAHVTDRQTAAATNAMLECKEAA